MTFDIDESWYNFFNSQKDTLEMRFSTIARRCKDAREIYLNDSFRIVPSPIVMFNAFKYCSFNNLKVVMLGLEPYSALDSHGFAYANGIGFSVFSNEDTPSIKVLISWLNHCYPKTIGKSYDRTFIPWCKQGVLLLNCALTTEVCDKDFKKISHKILWQQFIKATMEYCSRKRGIVFVLMGSNLTSYIEEVHDGNFVLHTVNPAYVSRKGEDIKSDVFLQINSHLKNPIDWTSIFE